MALTLEQSAVQLILAAAHNCAARDAIMPPNRVGGDAELYELVMRGPNSPKVAGRITEIAERVRVRLGERGVKLGADSLARWFAPELCV